VAPSKAADAAATRPVFNFVFTSLAPR
jgi:hypothetical protein